MKYWDSINAVSLALWPVALLFRIIAAIRRGLYRFGVLKSWRSPVPVIVVGNISVGGTGKTPVVIALVQWLKSKGYKPGVISRGYGGAERLAPEFVHADSEPASVGDEPVLIARRTAVPVCVFRKRVACAQQLLKNHDCDVLITDDGLQHYALQRDLEIIVVDAEKRHGNGFCLPAGPLREPVSRIGEKAFTLYNSPQAEDADDGNTFVLKPGPFIALSDASTQRSAEAFAGQEVFATAGTASPDRFFKTLASLGLKTKTRVFPDHHKFVADDFNTANGLPIIMTEKDAVKCQDFGLHNAWYLPVDARLPEQLLTRVLTQLGQPAAALGNG